MQTYPDHVCHLITTRRWCAFPVDLSGFLPTDRLGHQNMALAKGAPMGCCNLPAEVHLDGKNYCRRHAGETLLRAALDETESA